MDEVIYASATALAGAIRAKKVSSAETVEAHLRRIEAVNQKINARVAARINEPNTWQLTLLRPLATMKLAPREAGHNMSGLRPAGDARIAASLR